MVEPEHQGPAIEALGSLFKLTRVFLWDDGLTQESRKRPSFRDVTKVSHDGDAENDEYIALPEDVELARKMDALGLPVSFHTNKEMQCRDGMTKSKRKGTQRKPNYPSQNSVDEALEFSQVSVEENVSPTTFHVDDNCYQYSFLERDNPESFTAISCSPVEEENDAGILGVACDDGEDCDSNTKFGLGISRGSCLTDAAVDDYPIEDDGLRMDSNSLEGSSLTSEAEHGNIGEDSREEKTCNSETIDEYDMFSEVLGCYETNNNEHGGDFEDWMVYWDSYYSRKYFYNIKTHTSTWYAPPGMEHSAISDITDKLNEMVAETTQMDVSSTLDVTDLLRSKHKNDSFEKSLNNNTLASQPYKEHFDGIGFTNCNSVSSVTAPCITESKVEDPSELDQTNNSCEYETEQCFLSNSLEHIARDETGQLAPDVYGNSGFQLTFENIYEGKVADDILEETNRNSFSGESLVNCEDDIAFPTIDNSRVSSYYNAVSGNTGIFSGSNIHSSMKADTLSNLVRKKHKKKTKRTKNKRKLFNGNEEHKLKELVEFSADIGKYWCQRYLLFSRYDDGIKMDEEGWFSVTPESIARHHACRCGSGIILDCFTGVGGNAIQFAQRSKRVIALDIDPKKINYARHNAAIYGVDERIDFVKGDFFVLAAKLKADTVFLSPPWGGPDYAKVDTYDIMTMLKPYDGYFLFNTARKIASKIVMFLPRNVDLNQLAELSLAANPPWSLEVEKNYLNGRLKAITAYFSETKST